MYSSPSNSNAIGAAFTPAPAWNCQSRSPVLASNASKFPFPSPVNTSPPAVTDDLLAAQDPLPGPPVEDVEPPGLTGGAHRLDGLAPNGHVEQQRRARLVEVPDVVGNLLIVPGQLPVGRVDGHDRFRVEVVARPDPAVQVGGRVRDPHVDHVQVRSGRRDQTGRAAAALPGVLVLGPGPFFFGAIAVPRRT